MVAILAAVILGFIAWATWPLIVRCLLGLLSWCVKALVIFGMLGALVALAVVLSSAKREVSKANRAVTVAR